MHTSSRLIPSCAGPLLQTVVRSPGQSSRVVSAEVIALNRSPEHMKMMGARRRELAAQDPSRLGGRPRKAYLVSDTALELAELRPLAIQRLREQLMSRNEHIAQRAAIKVLEYSDGLPVKKVDDSNPGITTIIYETRALVEDRVHALDGPKRVGISERERSTRC